MKIKGPRDGHPRVPHAHSDCAPNVAPTTALTVMALRWLFGAAYFGKLDSAL